MSTIKPSPKFVSTFNKYKSKGLDEKEVTSLLNVAQKEISKSKTPHALAKVYENEVKGWMKKGIAAKEGTAEMGGWILRNSADSKSITDGAKYLKANAKAIIAKNPSLKDLDFSKAGLGDFGDSAYLNLVDKKSGALSDQDPRAKLVKKLLGAEFKSVAVGCFDISM